MTLRDLAAFFATAGVFFTVVPAWLVLELFLPSRRGKAHLGKYTRNEQLLAIALCFLIMMLGGILFAAGLIGLNR